MSYKIHTAPILDAYKTPCDCPLCLLEQQTEARIVASYLGAAVTAPEVRVRVNAVGFCKKHFDDLSHGDNILGLALQTKTRAEALRDGLHRCFSGKEAAKESARIKKALSSCVICEDLEAVMQRYYETTAALFGNEAAFEKVLRNANGHCLRHYAVLLRYASLAGKRAARFCEILYHIQMSSMAETDANLQGFIDLYDCMKTDKRPRERVSDALPKTIACIHSKHSD